MNMQASCSDRRACRGRVSNLLWRVLACCCSLPADRGGMDTRRGAVSPRGLAVRPRHRHGRCSLGNSQGAAARQKLRPPTHRGRRPCPACHYPTLPRLPWHEYGASLRDAAGLEPAVPVTGMQVVAEVRRKQRATASRGPGGPCDTRSFLRSPRASESRTATLIVRRVGHICVF